MATTGYATTVKVRGAYNQECGIFALTCEELPGLYLAGKDLQTLQDDVPAVIRALYKHDCGIDVVVTEVNARAPRKTAKSQPSANFIQLDREFVALRSGMALATA